jgi:type I restriction enzyme S subunit
MNIKLGDLCKIQAGGTPSRNISKYWENGDIPWVKIGDIESKFLNKTTEFITKEGLNNSSAKMIEKGSILYTIFATLGEVCITNIDVTTNQAIAGLTLRDDKVDLEYLYYFLKSLHLHVNSIGRGVAQNNINLTILREFSVPVPNRKKQLEIANILKVIENIIESRKKQIQEYDQLIKSRFVEMFGDIFTNEKRYRIGVFNDFVTQMNIGPFGSALKNDYFVSKDDGYCMVYEQKHAIRKNIYVDRRYVDLKKYNELSRFEVGPGDLIVSCRGTIGECHILPNDAPRGIIHPSLMMIKPKGSVNGKFLLHLLERILERQLDNGSGVKMAIQAKELAKVKTIVPDRHLQDEYVLFVEQVDKLKFEVLKLLRELR